MNTDCFIIENMFNQPETQGPFAEERLWKDEISSLDLLPHSIEDSLNSEEIHGNNSSSNLVEEHLNYSTDSSANVKECRLSSPPFGSLPEQGIHQKLKKEKKDALPKKSYKVISKCKHAESTYYAAGMCKNCYHAKGRTKLASKCEHNDRPLYAKGICKNCYLSLYHKAKRV